MSYQLYAAAVTPNPNLIQRPFPQEPKPLPFREYRVSERKGQSKENEEKRIAL